MGWIWASGTTPKPNITTKSEPTTATTSTTTMTKPVAPEPTNDETEIAKFFSQLQADFNTPTPTPTPKPTPPPTPYYPQSTTPPEAHLDPVSESLLPTTMSCRQAFDLAFNCNSLGGQWTSIYRTGTMRSCSEHWDDFWFCMRTRAYTGAVKEDAIRDYYRQKELRKYGAGKPASTDVWEPRRERLPADSVFQDRYVKPQISDEEWRQLDIQRRRAVQQTVMEEMEERRARSDSSS
ncbi:hypothetical protein GGS21DRAFT_530961 [Xylaria nigripes]|nr:hypothetical protein GGS21DRAFT_530961 [Xylaria nigripes]